MDDLRGNDFLDRLAAGELTLMLAVRGARSSEVVLLAAATGHHCVMIDLEHSTMSVDTAAALCRAATAAGLMDFVRVPEREYGMIGRLLDGGANGIIAPRIENAAQARDVARACRFPPRGVRSQTAMVPQSGMRPVPARELNGALDARVVVQILVETPAGVANAGEIAAVDGVDLIAFGANDFTAELGVPGQYGDHRVRDAVAALAEACRNHGKLLMVGGIGDPGLQRELMALGACPLVMTGNDNGLLYEGAARRAEQLTKALGPAARHRPTEEDEAMRPPFAHTLPMRPADTNTLPWYRLPADSCDTHFHVFEPGYPAVPDPLYTFPDGTIEAYLRVADRLGISRMVLVQPTYYGTDNTLLLDALRKIGPRCRGVARIGDDITGAELDRFHEAGVRALRLDLFARADWPVEDLVAYVRAMAEHTRPRGWHLQFYSPGTVVKALLPFLAQLEDTFVIDHMGYMKASDGLTEADFGQLLDVLRGGNGYVKLSGPYRIAQDKPLSTVEHLGRALVEARPDRLVWGSDWPHLPNGQRDTGELLDLLADWAPGEADRHGILVEAPRRLFYAD